MRSAYFVRGRGTAVEIGGLVGKLKIEERVSALPVARNYTVSGSISEMDAHQALNRNFVPVV